MRDTAARFLADLEGLAPGARLGVAVSGGPDSLALLLLAHEARPGAVEAATVDHQLRASSRAESDQVAGICERLGIAHTILTVEVPAGASLQAQAREARYAALAQWASKRELTLLTAHHADDQAETLLMRLSRGAGLAGLAGVRASRIIHAPDGASVRLVRPLLAWRKRDLGAVVAAAGFHAIDDPSNDDERHDRTGVRRLLKSSNAIDAAGVSASAAHLAEAEEALAFATQHFAEGRLVRTGNAITLAAADLPPELQRRLLLAAFARLNAPAPRGPDLERALKQVRQGATCTLSGLLLSGGEPWRLEPEPPRRQ